MHHLTVTADLHNKGQFAQTGALIEEWQDRFRNQLMIKDFNMFISSSSPYIVERTIGDFKVHAYVPPHKLEYTVEVMIKRNDPDRTFRTSEDKVINRYTARTFKEGWSSIKRGTKVLDDVLNQLFDKMRGGDDLADWDL